MRTWTPVIPKSVLFVVADQQANPENWSLTLLLNPTDKVPIILICDGVFLLVLGLVIIVQHLHEKVSFSSLTACEELEPLWVVCAELQGEARVELS